MLNSAKAQQTQSGNVILLVLVAVIMFTALTFVVSNTMNNSSPEAVSAERAKLLADYVIDYARVMRNAVQDMRINGCEIDEISLANNFITGYEHAPQTRDDCRLFYISGGGVNYQVPSNDVLAEIRPEPAMQGEWFFPANVCIPQLGTIGADDTKCNEDGLDNESLIAFLPYINRTVCEQINERLGRGTTIPQEPGNAWPSAATLFTGSLNDSDILEQDGLTAGCIEGTTIPPAGTYHFYQILVAR